MPGVALDAFVERWTRQLPTELSGPKWEYLDHLAASGYLLHGSQDTSITMLEPRAPIDHSPDDFSKQTAVFLTSNAIWAISWALRGPQVRGTMNTCIQLQTGNGWSDWMHYFAAAPRNPGVRRTGASLLSPGVVYVVEHGDTDLMPAYEWPGVGTVREPQHARPTPARVLDQIPVSPDDYPLPVATYDMDRVLALSSSDPWGFPWPEVH